MCTIKKDSDVENEQKARLIDVARSLFANKGYEATTTRKINQMAKTSDGLLYYYFPEGKKQLLNSVLIDSSTERSAKIEAFVFPEVNSLSDMEESLMAFLQTVWENLILPNNYQVFLITIHEQQVLTTEQIQWITQLNQLIQNKLLEFLRQNERLLPKPDEIEVMVKGLIANVQALIFTELVIKNQQNLTRSLIDELRQQVDFIMAN